MSSSSTNTYYTYYVPSAPAAIVVAIIFFVLTALHIWRIFSTRHWFAFAIVVGGIFEFVGLAARAYSGKHLSEEGPYIVQVLLILLAPILFAASVYMFLGRLIRASGHPQLSFIRINWLTKIFVCGDIFCFFVQAAGAAQLVNADTTSEIDRAQDIILAGLALQVLFFCVFAVCAVIFHRRIHVNHFKQYIDPSVHLSMMLYSLYFCSLLITVRNVYRFIEYKSGTTGYLQEHEWPMYGLDVCLMAVIMVVTMFWYSANVKASDNEAFPLTDQESAHF